MSLSPLLSRDIISKFDQARIAVIGDMTADLYLFGRPSRLSREAPVMVVQYEGQSLVPGSAANTVNNLARLGAQVFPIGVLGDDEEGKGLYNYFAQEAPGLKLEGLFFQRGRGTVTKTRIMAGDQHTCKQQVIRIDKEPFTPVSKETEQRMLRYLDMVEPQIEGLLVSDYGYETITPKVLQRINALAKKKKVIVDSRYRLLAFKGAAMMTPNESEALQSTRMSLKRELNLERVGERLLTLSGCQAVLLTRGNQGMLLFERGKRPYPIPIWGPEEITDVTGAGDTVAAVCALSLVSGSSFLKAAQLSNLAAGLVVMKRGCATVTQEELLAALENHHGSID